MPGRAQWLLAGGLAAGLLGAGLWWWPAAEHGTVEAPLAQPATQPSAVQWWNNPGPSGAVDGGAVASASAGGGPGGTPGAVADLSQVPEADRTFNVDAQGRLRLDEQTRLKVEALLALNQGDDLQAALDEQVAGLPLGAATAARDLVRRYQAFDAALKQAVDTEAEPTSPEAALDELAGLHTLRERHFGADMAQRLYGEEEAISRRLLELMREDPIPEAHLGEKAMRAQARYDAERSGAALPAPPR